MFSAFIAEMGSATTAHMETAFDTFDTRLAPGADLSIGLDPQENGLIVDSRSGVLFDPRKLGFTGRLGFLVSGQVPFTKLLTQV